MVGTPFEVARAKCPGAGFTAFPSTPPAAAKVISDYRKTNDKLIIKGRRVRWQIARLRAKTASIPANPFCWHSWLVAEFCRLPASRVLAAVAEKKSAGQRCAQHLVII